MCRLKIFFVAYRLFELYGHEANMKLLAKELIPLQGIGSQTCITFSVDGSKFAAGGLVSITLDSNQLHLFPVGCGTFEFFLFRSESCLFYFGWSLTRVGRMSQNYGVA